MNKQFFQTSKKTIIIICSMFLSALIILFIMIYNLQISYDKAKNDVVELSKDNSLRCAKQIDTYFSRHSDVLLTSAKALEYLLANNVMNEDDIEKFLNNISITFNDELYEKTFKTEFSGVFASVNGVLLHGMRSRSELREGYDPTQRPWYIEGKEAMGNIVFGDPYIDTYNEEIIDISASKLLNDNSTVVAMDLTTQDMQTLIDSIDISVSFNGSEYLYGYGFLLTKNGKVVCHSKDALEINKDYSELDSPMYEVYNRISSSTDNQYFDYFKVDNTNYGYFSNRLSNDWYYICFIDLDNIKTTTSDILTKMSLLTSLIIIFVFVYCGVITKSYINSDKMGMKLKKTLNMAMIDSLTGVLNRAAFDLKIKALNELMLSKDDESFAIFMIDLNDLKFINDNYGHKEGDIYINNCCKLIQDVFPCDLYRIGGDEFALILSNDLFDHWYELLDKIKSLTAKANNELNPSALEPSIAIGVSVHTVGANDNIDSMMRKADTDMYANKADIKNRRLKNSKTINTKINKKD